jgi:hypothetical protein
MRVWHALVALVAGGLIAGAADAADAPPPLAITSVAASLPQGQSPALHVELSDPSLDTGLLLTNSGDQPLSVKLGTTPLARSDGTLVCDGGTRAAACTASWRLSENGSLVPLPAEITLAPHASLTARLIGEVRELGTYRAQLSATAPNLAATAIVEVQRVAATLPADLWTPPAAAWAVEIVPWGHHGIGMQASLRNATGHRLQLLGPGVLSQTRARGEKDVVATDLHPQVTRGDCPAGDPLALLADQQCTVEVALPKLTATGHYAVKLGVSGTGGGSASVTLDVNVRNPWWWAAILILAGVLGGWVVRAWRTGGRDAYFQLADLAGLVQEFDRLAARAADEDMRALIRRLRRQAVDLRDRLRGGQSTANVPDYATLRARADAIESTLEIDRVYAQLGVADAGSVEAQRQAALTALRDDGQTAQARQQAIEAYHQAVENALAIANVRRRFQLFVADTDRSLAIAAAPQFPAAVREAATAARDARAPVQAALAARNKEQAETALTEAHRAYARLLRALVDWLTENPPAFFPAAAAWATLVEAVRADAPGLGQIDAAEGAALATLRANLEGALRRLVEAIAHALREAIPTMPPAEQGPLRAELDSIPAALEHNVVEALRILLNAMQRYANAMGAAAVAAAPIPAPALGVAGAAPPPLPESPFPPLFPAGASRRRILAAAAVMDMLTFIVGLVVIVLGGVQTLWIGQPAWGGPGDWIAAVLWGGGLYLALDNIVRPAARPTGG